MSTILLVKKKTGVAVDMKIKKRVPLRTPRYHRLTLEHRIIIRALMEEKICPAQIARRIGCSRSTISREIRRNISEKGYRPKNAQGKADARVMAKAAARRKMTESIWTDAASKISAGWTFEQISGRAKRDEKPTVSRETFYKEYYRRQALVRRGESDEALPPLPRRQKMRRTRDRNAGRYRDAGRGRIPGRVDIDQRPKTVEHRARVGNWEGDLINGLKGTGNLVTVTERMTRFTLVSYAATKETDGVMAAIIGMMAGLPKDMLGSLTFDNGKEFAAFPLLERTLGVKVYFAKPYHSWERGTNENRNGVVRRVLPKGVSFSGVTDEEMRRVDYMLNDRPMKCLGWRTPREAFTSLLKRHLQKSRA